ncbi:MAG TPA: hypothetical protein PK393_06435, partial [Synergistaceae bacterium]|nr:hypothetical protein [Synergistaceae bacterium]HQK25142.1 hypothetical protein [Synergistaceae bacterium]
MDPLDMRMLFGGRDSRPFAADEGPREGGDDKARREGDSLSFDAVLALVGASFPMGIPAGPPAPSPDPEAPGTELRRPPLLARLFYAPGEGELPEVSLPGTTAPLSSGARDHAGDPGGQGPTPPSESFPRDLGVSVSSHTSRVALAGGVPGAMMRSAPAVPEEAEGAPELSLSLEDFPPDLVESRGDALPPELHSSPGDRAPRPGLFAPRAPQGET